TIARYLTPEAESPEGFTPEPAPKADPEEVALTKNQAQPAGTTAKKEPRAPTSAELRFADVKVLQDQGMSQRAVANQLQMSRGTVRRYWLLDEYPERQPGFGSVSSVTPYLPTLLQLWQDGEQNRKNLWKQLQEQGFTGSYASVWRATNRLAGNGRIAFEKSKPTFSIPTPSSRRAAWLFTTPTDELKAEQQLLCQAIHTICAGAEEVYQPAQDFGEMIRNRQVEAFDAWLLRPKLLPSVNSSASPTACNETMPQSEHLWNMCGVMDK
ncbi:MAG: hypothetical protein KDD92_11940, partial [Caldilineaceae bacterium]|nr:hypothetical protein [Caldilineaceae bacterium]